MTVNREKTQQAAERHVRRGNWDKAISLYLELVHDDPSDLRSKLKLADLYTRVDDMPKAIQTYLEVGQGYERLNEFDKAAAVYKVARAAVPDNWEISEMLGNLFSKMGRNKEALQVLGEVYLGYSSNDDGKRAQGVLETMAMLDPEDVGLKIQLAERYKKQQDTRRALNTFHAAADILRAEGRADELFQVMQRILYLSPESLDVRKDVIKGLLERNEEKKALQHFRTAIEEAPEDLELLNLLGITFEKLDSIDNAVEVYERMIGLYGEQTYKPRVQQLQDRILEIAPDSPSAKIIRAEREGRVTGLEEATADEGGFDLLNGEDLFGDRDILDDVEFLDDPFGVIGTESPSVVDGVDPNEFTRFSQPLGNPAPVEDFDFMNSPQGFDPELTTQVSTDGHGLDSPTYVHTGSMPLLDDAPTQEDAEPANLGRKDVTSLLKRVESFFQFNLFGQADELTRDIITLAPDNFLARDQRRRICENLGYTEEAADQLMEMARIVVDDPRLSSKYLSRAMTLTNNPQRFEAYANQIRSQWQDVSRQPLRETSAERRAFSLPKPGNSETEFRDPQHPNRRVTKSFEPGGEGGEHPLRLEEINVDGNTFDEIDLADIQNIPVNYISEGDGVETFFIPNQPGAAPAAPPEAKENFDLDFLDGKDKLANIFDDIDIDFSKFGEQSLSSAFMSKDLLQLNPIPEEGGEPSVANQLNSLEVGEVYLQSGRYNDAIEVIEPLLNDADDRVKAQLLLADVYIELGDIPKAAEFLFSIINEEVSTPEQRAEAQAKLSKIG